MLLGLRTAEANAAFRKGAGVIRDEARQQAAGHQRHDDAAYCAGLGGAEILGGFLQGYRDLLQGRVGGAGPPTSGCHRGTGT